MTKKKIKNRITTQPEDLKGQKVEEIQDPLELLSTITDSEKMEPFETQVIDKKESYKAIQPETEAFGFTNEPVVTLKIFSTVSGVKWDQLAGFKRYAESQKLGPLTINNWKKELDKFKQRPTI